MFYGYFDNVYSWVWGISASDTSSNKNSVNDLSELPIIDELNDAIRASINDPPPDDIINDPPPDDIIHEVIHKTTMHKKKKKNMLIYFKK
jgi:hypothetical protein